jgi:hypothetical protein
MSDALLAEFDIRVQETNLHYMGDWTLWGTFIRKGDQPIAEVYAGNVRESRRRAWVVAHEIARDCQQRREKRRKR